MDEEFTDAEIRVLLKKVASDRRRNEMRQRLERAGDPQHKPENGTTTETPRSLPSEITSTFGGRSVSPCSRQITFRLSTRAANAFSQPCVKPSSQSARSTF